MINVSIGAPPETVQPGILPRPRSAGNYTTFFRVSHRVFLASKILWPLKIPMPNFGLFLFL